MKKLIVTILTVVFALTLAFGVVGCGGDNGNQCEHTYAKKWTKLDDEYHCKKATCGCEGEMLKEKHKWSQGVADANGNPTYKCNTCGATKQ